MAINRIFFQGLPFRPDPHQVFFIENGYDEEVNSFIRSHYYDLKDLFRSFQLDFYYLPYLTRENNIEEKLRYYAPYLDSQLLVAEVKSNILANYIASNGGRENLRPSFIAGAMRKGGPGDVLFYSIPFDNLSKDDNKVLKSLQKLIDRVRTAIDWDIDQAFRRYEAERSDMCYSTEEPSAADSVMPNSSVSCEGSNLAEDAPIMLRSQVDPDEALSHWETNAILRDLRMTVQRLRLEGVSLMAIHEFIDKQEPLSRMVITPDYRIILPDYHNMEIDMGALPKAIYFLYLRYPQGIVSKHLQDHFCELLNIYKQLRPNTDEARLNLTITKVVNPLGNALNENIARIRKAFVEKFDEHLANNYIITGERGQQYYIALDRTLIEWEE